MTVFDLKVRAYVPLLDPMGGDGKFVLIINGSDLHVVLSPIAKTPYHANIVALYLGEGGHAAVEMLPGPHCRISTPGWSVKGGGYYAVLGDDRTLRFYGKSTAFGRYARKLLDPYIETLPQRLGLPGFRLSLE